MKDYRKCPYCGSIKVCWNWIHGDISKEWYHECWDCENVLETPEKVTDGIPHDELVGK